MDYLPVALGVAALLVGLGVDNAPEGVVLEGVGDDVLSFVSSIATIRVTSGPLDGRRIVWLAHLRHPAAH